MMKTMRTAVVGVALALAGVLAGVLSAQALGQVELPVTVSVPTVSLPIPTTPAPPTPPPVPPVPLPPAPAPPVPLPPPPVVTAPTAPTPSPPVTLPVSPSPAPAAPGSSSGSAPTPSTGAGYRGSGAGTTGAGLTGASSDDRRRATAARAGKARVTGIRARPARTKRRGQRKGAARITFTLNAAARVVFVVRGPAPSCDIAGRFQVRGSRGTNHVRFTGRLGRRNLPYGTYRITARTGGGRKASRPVVVVLGERGAPDNFACGGNNELTSLFESIVGTFSNGSNGGISSGESMALGGSQSGPQSEGSSAEGASRQRNATKKRDSGVLPAVTEKLSELPGALPRPSFPEASASPHWIIGAGALILLVLSALALVGYVVRFLRRPHAT